MHQTSGSRQEQRAAGMRHFAAVYGFVWDEHCAVLRCMVETKIAGQ